MNTDTILKNFKESHPKLLKLNPEITMSQIIFEDDPISGEMITYNPPKLRIEISHPFIFDRRLVPTEFNGVKIQSIMTGGYPNTFPSENAALPLEEWFAPENYEKFVSQSLDKIQKCLKDPSMSHKEALDALTGGFEIHKKECKEKFDSRNKESKEEIEFFNQLIKKTKIAFDKSDVKKLKDNKGWGYAVTATMFKKNWPLIIGFNWGVDSKWVNAGNEYGSQENYPFRHFESNYDEMAPLNKTIPFFYEYFNEALGGMHTNFCFFRSEKENQISDKDLELSSELFYEYLNYTQPSCVISFSNSLKNYFINTGKLEDLKPKEIRSNNKTIRPLRAKLKLNDEKIDFIYLPHPNSIITSEAREAAWKYCFEKQSYKNR